MNNNVRGLHIAQAKPREQDGSRYSVIDGTRAVKRYWSEQLSTLTAKTMPCSHHGCSIEPDSGNQVAFQNLLLPSQRVQVKFAAAGLETIAQLESDEVNPIYFPDARHMVTGKFSFICKGIRDPVMYHCLWLLGERGDLVTLPQGICRCGKKQVGNAISELEDGELYYLWQTSVWPCLAAISSFNRHGLDTCPNSRRQHFTASLRRFTSAIGRWTANWNASREHLRHVR